MKADPEGWHHPVPGEPEPPYRHPEDIPGPDDDPDDDDPDTRPAWRRWLSSEALAVILLVLFSCTITAPPRVQRVQVTDTYTVAGPEGAINYWARIEYVDEDGVTIVMTYQVSLREYMAVRGHLDACLINGRLERCE